jgi:2-dehydropantoate 2-reductase
MKVCIVGAGAIGGLIGTRLAVAGRAQVSAIARGATLAALQQHGWQLRTAQGLLHAPAQACASAGELGPQDLVVIAVKGPALTQVAQGLAPLLGPATVVLPAMNGVPWWFCQGVPGFPGGGALQSVDPGGVIGAAIPFERVLGCVVHASASTPETGVVQHRVGDGLIVGEPLAAARTGLGPHDERSDHSERAQAIVDLLAHAGFNATLSADVRYDVWYKLWGNMTMNPVSAITGATIDGVLGDPLVRAFCSAAMGEAAAIGARIGCRIDQTPENRHAMTARLGAFKTSMLQDVEAGRPLELDAIVGAVHEIGRHLGIATPNIDALLGLTRLFGRVRGLYPAQSA